MSHLLSITSGVRPVPSVFLLLCMDTEWISMRFMGGFAAWFWFCCNVKEALVQTE